MIDRIIEYSARNRFLVILLVALASAAGVCRSARARSTRSRICPTCK